MTERGPTDRPRFCPGCRKSRRTESGLCPFCGDTLAVQGYCEVCRAHWLRPAGADCPKHEIPLIDGPAAASRPFGPDEPIRWTTIGRYWHALEAEGPRSRLQWEGVPTFVDGDRTAGHAGGVAGSVRLQVPEGRVGEAREILSRSWSTAGDEPDGAVDDAEPDADEAGDEPDAPEAIGPSRLVGWGLGVLLVIAGLRAIVLAFR